MSDLPTPIQIDWPERRPPSLGWLKGHAAAAVLSFDMDAETPILAVDARYAGHLSTMSHQAYGPRIGVPRILSLLRSLEVRATFFVPGATAQRWPDAVSHVLEDGHEVALHSYSHTELIGLDEGEQRRDLEHGLQALAVLGVEPIGYRAPMWQQTRFTLDLLPEYGLRYDSSLMDDDQPYRIGRDGALVELPVHWSLDDWEQYAFVPQPDVGQNIEHPDKVLSLWTTELDAMRATRSLCTICCHPFLTGRPSRLRNVERFVDFARECGDVWLTTCDEVARRAQESPEPAR